MRAFSGFSLACLLFFSQVLMASSASQVITISVGIMNSVSLEGGTVSLTTDEAEFVDGKVEVYNSSAKVDIFTNEEGNDFTASLNRELPNGVELYVRIIGGDRTGTATVIPSYQRLSTSSVDLVTDMNDFFLDDGNLDFKMVASEDADPITESYTMTLSIVEG